MSDKIKLVPIAFLVVITALFVGIVLPELFTNIISQQTPENHSLYDSIRILLMITVMLIALVAHSKFVGGKNV
jgi:hypothetical protein